MPLLSRIETNNKGYKKMVQYFEKNKELNERHK